jgi:thymidylate synthase
MVNGRKTLHLKLYSRSLDYVLGYWQAAMQYRMFQMALCKMLDLDLGMMVTDLWDVHIYDNQWDYACELLTREEGRHGVVELMTDVHNIDDILKLDHTDFIVLGYKPNREPFKNPRPPMAV